MTAYNIEQLLSLSTTAKMRADIW